MHTDDLAARAELFFRTHIHTIFPLHAALVDAICGGPKVPVELATVLEDIGQGYIRLSETLNRELSRRREMNREPWADEASETRIDNFVHRFIAQAGRIEFHDGQVVDARRALESSPATADAIRTALLIGKGWPAGRSTL